MREVLDGIGVVELASGVAGGYCGKVLADLGADVIKVEGPGGDPLRQARGAWAHLATNKRSVSADAASEADRKALAELIGQAALAIEAPGEGGLADWGLEAAQLLRRFPSLVVVSITGFGATGPYAGYRWSDLIAQAFSGTVIQHDGPRGPLRLPGVVGLSTVGHTSALGGLAAVMVAARGGGGTVVDCAAYEALVGVPWRNSVQLSYEYSDRRPLEIRTVAAGSTLFPMGNYPCADGYVAMMSTAQQLNEMLEVLDSDELRTAFAHPDALNRAETAEAMDRALYPWLLSHTRAEITEIAQRAGWPLAGINTPADVLGAAHFHQRGFWAHVEDPDVGPLLLPGAPYRHSEGGWRIRRRAPRLGEHGTIVDVSFEQAIDPVKTETRPPGPPLTGVRVLDLTTVWSGPGVTLLLADLGAEVIRVENPYVFPPTTKGYVPRPDPEAMFGIAGTTFAPPAPDRPDRPYNRGSWNNAVSRNKRSVTLDIRTAEGREILYTLAERADVLVENFKSETLHRLGIHETELLSRNPRLVVLRLPPAGLSGDWARYTGFGAQFDGLTGMTSLTGHMGCEVFEAPSTAHMDSATGSAGAFAVMAALWYRHVTGRGQVVELAQCENVMNHLGDVFVDQQIGVEPERRGNRDPRRAPQGFYRCGEGWLAVSVGSDDEWASLCELLGSGELAVDPRFAHGGCRQDHHEELDQVLQAYVEKRDLYDTFHDLQKAGVPAAPLLDAGGFADDPHVQAREMLRPTTSLDTGTHLHVGQAFRGVPLAWWRGSPSLGQDNEYVYKEILGLDDAAHQDLVDRGVAVEDYLDAEGNPY